MGDLTKMVPFDALDGTKRMARWDFYAASLAEGVLAESGRPPTERNMLLGVEVTLFDATALSAMVWAALASGDRAMKKDNFTEPRLSLEDVRQLMDESNSQECIKMIAGLRKENSPDAVDEGKRPTKPKKKAPGKKKASR